MFFVYFLTTIHIIIIAVTSKTRKTMTIPPEGTAAASKVVVHSLTDTVCSAVLIMNESVKNQFLIFLILLQIYLYLRKYYLM